MKSLWIGIVVLVIALLLALFLMFDKSEPMVCFDEDCFIVEIVDNQAEREMGLMFRESLNEDAGMFFIFESEGNYPFWMKNTLIPLDIIWIDIKGNIVDIKSTVPCEVEPCPITSPFGNAKYVLEINSGLTSERGIIVGQKAEFIYIN